ncbi:MAG: carbamoyltransferase HypF, partial [Bacteroidota bacterium]
YDTQLHYELSLRYWLELLTFKPEQVLIDLHPQYVSSILGKQIAAETGAEVKAIQHHEAHAMAILAEHNKCQTEERILCVVWDGTGLGWDGQIWGGESFLYEQFRLTRVAHLPYVPVLGGDKMAQEPRLAALSLAKRHPFLMSFLESYFEPNEWVVYQGLLNHAHIHGSSMGRLFDAVSALLGIGTTQSYEGEAAMRLEAQAWRWLRTNNWPTLPAALLQFQEGFPLEAFLAYLVKSRIQGRTVPELAAAFHVFLGQYIHFQAQIHQVQTLAFSGGVFQNALLTTWLRAHLSPTYELLFHTLLPANDEHLALGQMVRWQVETQPITSYSLNYVSRNSR